MSPSRGTFRPQLEALEGRALPSGVGDVILASPDLAPQTIIQGPAQEQIQVQEVSLASDAQTLEAFGFEKTREQHLDEYRQRLERWGSTPEVIDSIMANYARYLSPEQYRSDPSAVWNPDHVSVRRETVPSLTLSVDDLKTPPSSTNQSGGSSNSASDPANYTESHKGMRADTFTRVFNRHPDNWFPELHKQWFPDDPSNGGTGPTVVIIQNFG